MYFLLTIYVFFINTIRAWGGGAAPKPPLKGNLIKVNVKKNKFAKGNVVISTIIHYKNN
jgi:hypothetical protein